VREVAEASILRRSDVQKILRAMIEGGVSVAEPTVDFEGVRYLKVEEAAEESSSTVNEALSLMESAGFLLSEPVASLFVCPKCGSHKLMIQLSCPACGSVRVEKASMIEHMSCGYVDREEKFMIGGELKCPRCGRMLRGLGVDYRRLGIMAVCSACGGRFPAPVRKYMCSRLHTFEENEAGILQVKAYRLNPAKRSIIESEIIDFRLILEGVSGGGWIFQAPAVLKGRSGVEHRFAFAVWGEGKNPSKDPPDVLADMLVSDGEVDSNQVFASLAKIFDVKPWESLLIAVPRVSESARMVARSYDVNVIEAEGASQLKEKVAAAIFECMGRREKEALRMEVEALREAVRELEEQEVMPENVRRGLADLDRRFFEGEIGLEDYVRERKRLLEPAKT
jgi:transcription elongation factor Elf1